MIAILFVINYSGCRTAAGIVSLKSKYGNRERTISPVIFFFLFHTIIAVFCSYNVNLSYLWCKGENGCYLSDYIELQNLDRCRRNARVCRRQLFPQLIFHVYVSATEALFESFNGIFFFLACIL